ncbi:hypothetical protein [Cytobacillus firmus]|nr:hypothetical protein [Cytobacillus firmus]
MVFIVDIMEVGLWFLWEAERQTRAAEERKLNKWEPGPEWSGFL